MFIAYAFVLGVRDFDRNRSFVCVRVLVIQHLSKYQPEEGKHVKGRVPPCLLQQVICR